MKTNEVIKEIRENGGLDIPCLRYSWKCEGSRCSFRKYVKNYIKSSYQVSDYVACKVCVFYGIR